MHTDPIADTLTRIRNAQAVKKKTVSVRYSKIIVQIIALLKDEGYIKKYSVAASQRNIAVDLLYDKQGNPKIKRVTRMSTPGRKMYVAKKHLPVVLHDYGIAVISTNQGLITNKKARESGIGGEILCEIY